MITTKKSFNLSKSKLSHKFRVENNNLDISNLINSSDFKIKKISEIAVPHRNERNRKETKDSEIKYIQISDIDISLGRIKSYRKFIGSQAPNNARRIMNYGDILISTRRPTRGAIVTVPKEFDKEICTVFFTTLTINNWNEVWPWYLSLFLRTSLGRFQFQSMITETAYPVISDDDVMDIQVLLPSIEKQKEISENYSDSIKVYFEQLNNAYNSLIVSKQSIENYILRDEAEIIKEIKFGLDIEEIEEEFDDNNEEKN
jgi:type I restriction enzyme S subunit